MTIVSRTVTENLRRTRELYPKVQHAVKLRCYGLTRMEVFHLELKILLNTGLTLQCQNNEKFNYKSEGCSSGVRECLLGIAAITHGVPTNLNVCLLVSLHLSEAERRDVAPHSKGLGNASTCVAGIDQVCREGEQPARKQRSLKWVSSTYSSTESAKNAVATVPTSSLSTPQLLLFFLMCANIRY